ncbi:MAG TPA: glycosyltransferase [Candidatus Saccharimonadales bacterium]|nr:glycosyltransferase [Candidatus Saccharimonadales bacterium]
MVDKTRIGIILVFSLLIGAVIPPIVTFVVVVLLALLVVIITLLKFSHPSNKRPPEPVFDSSYTPYVAVIIACSNEPAHIVNRVLSALSKQAYEHYKVYVIDNNNTWEANWKKIEQKCQDLGDRFVFHHADSIAGYKAGALNYVQNLLPARVEIVTIVDADYIVTPTFLAETVGYFKDESVAIVQTPQDYSNKNENTSLYNDYELFFSRFMNQAQAFNGVTFTGTMGMIRKKLFDSQLTWSESSITEDTELGISIHKLGYSGVYVDKSFGQGVMPFNYDSLARQRTRWVYGNMQILKARLWQLIGDSSLTLRQKISFVNQLFAWIHFELLLAIIFVANGLSWFLYGDTFQCLIAKIIAVTLIASMVGQLGLFLFYSRSHTSITDRIKGFLAHYSLLPAMTYPWMYCLLGGRLGFVVTNKEQEARRRSGKRIVKGAFIPVLLTIGLLLTGWGKMFGEGLFVSIGVITLIEIASLIYMLEEFKEL